MTSGPAQRVTTGRGGNSLAVDPSPAALAANAMLEELRRTAGIVTRPPGAGLDQDQGAAASTARPSPALAGQGQARLEALRLEYGVNYRRPGAVEAAAWSAWAAERSAGDDLDQGGAGLDHGDALDQVGGHLEPGHVAGSGCVQPPLDLFYGAGTTLLGLPGDDLDGAALDQGAPGRANVGHIEMGHAAASTGRPLPFPEDDHGGRVDGGALDQDPGAALATVYPRLAAAILQAGHAAAGRLWLLLLASEPTRRGAYDLDQVYETFGGAGSAWRIGGRRRVQQVLKGGGGIFWTRDSRGRLWRHGPARVAAALGLAGGVGAPVEVPVTHLLEGMHSTRAALFAAALTGQDDPIGQATLEGLTGACPNSQRAYRRSAGVEARPQYRFLEGAADRAALQDAHWQHGAPVFVFIDHDGRHGKGRGALLLAKRGPNAYAATLEPARRGRTRKINRRLNLVTNGARGNEPAADYERFYFQDAGAAGSAYNRAGGRRACAYRLDQAAAGVDFWATIGALSGGPA